MIRRTRVFMLVAALMAIESLGRLLPSGLFRLLPAPVNYVDLALGTVEMVSVIGLFLLFRWGYWGAIAISAITIIFDIWGAFAIYPTALLGIPVPVFVLSYFVPRRPQLTEGQ